MSLVSQENSSSSPIPAIRVDAEYIQSLSVKNESLVDLLRESDGEADTQLSLNVNAHSQGHDGYAVTVQVRLQVGAGKKANFSIDLDYQGIFHITSANESILPVILFVQCPYLLFPALRHIVTSITQNSGLPPFHMQPINFMEMFQQKMKEKSTQAKG